MSSLVELEAEEKGKHPDVEDTDEDDDDEAGSLADFIDDEEEDEEEEEARPKKRAKTSEAKKAGEKKTTEKKTPAPKKSAAAKKAPATPRKKKVVVDEEEDAEEPAPPAMEHDEYVRLSKGKVVLDVKPVPLIIKAQRERVLVLSQNPKLPKCKCGTPVRLSVVEKDGSKFWGKIIASCPQPPFVGDTKVKNPANCKFFEMVKV